MVIFRNGMLSLFVSPEPAAVHYETVSIADWLFSEDNITLGVLVVRDQFFAPIVYSKFIFCYL